MRQKGIDPMRTRTISPTPARRTERRTGHAAARRASVSGEQRVRDAGGPQDTAHYQCGCGLGFEGSVSTHVACPRCGTDQDW
jgi:hypothetical protein